jgi:hypothetical protein
MIAAMVGGNKGTRLVLVRWNVEIDTHSFAIQKLIENTINTLN